MTPPTSETLPVRGPSPLIRWALRSLGSLCVGLGVAGVVLPLVPTTPFLLLAAACFARSSPRLYRRMLDNPKFGPYLKQWRTDHSVPRAAKRRAYLLVAVTFALSIAMVDPLRLKLGLAVLACILIAGLSRIPATAKAPTE